MRLTITALCALTCMAQQQPTVQITKPVVTLDQTPVFRTTVVSRTVKSINYRHRSGATKVNFEGTSILPKATGEAKVESKKGYVEIEVEFRGMKPAQQSGEQWLTWVLWAISPEGRATNLGELLLDSEGRAKVNVTTELQAFGMIVTAEPYYAVTQPSNMVGLENIVRKDTLGKVEDMTANYDLLDRVEYPFRHDEVRAGEPVSAGKRPAPLELLEAERAVRIARWTGADQYAVGEFRKAEQLLEQSRDYHVRKQTKPTAMIARQAVQTAEDARAITVKRIQAERLEAERRAAAEREAAERAKAEAASAAKLKAEEDARLEAALRARADADRRQAEAARVQAEEQQRIEAERRTRAEAERVAAERAKAEADAARQLAAKEKAEAEAARAAAIAQQQALASDVEKARAAAAEAERQRARAEGERAQAEGEREKLRQQLRDQLNAILETTDTARGLIVNMSDVLFDFGKYTLKPGTREKLARLSGLVLAYPGLRLDVEGHTDSIGTDEFNQRLSEQRAGAVREYLVSQGVNSGNVSARGLGKTQPVASNQTAEGRQRNRRVELVVSGEIIGTKISHARPAGHEQGSR
ncbi:MAG: OmpA family protein [Bryobacteraceae bacterium]